MAGAIRSLYAWRILRPITRPMALVAAPKTASPMASSKVSAALPLSQLRDLRGG